MILIYYYIFLANRQLGKQTGDGSEILPSNFHKYRSIKDIHKLKNYLGKKIVVAYFNHDACSSCKELSPEFIKLKSSNKIEYININAGVDEIDFMSVGILFVPTVLIYDIDGDLHRNFTGLMNGSAEKVINGIKESLIEFLN